jgi:hypothetical protein
LAAIVVCAGPCPAPISSLPSLGPGVEEFSAQSSAIDGVAPSLKDSVGRLGALPAAGASATGLRESAGQSASESA